MIGTFFKLFNFGLFVGLILYYFRSSIRAVLVRTVMREKAEWNSRVAHKALLEKEYTALERKEQEQTELYQELQAKVAQWQKTVAQEQATHLIEQRSAAHRRQERAAHQGEAYQRHKLEKQLVPPAFCQAVEELTAQYQNREEADAYIKKALSHLTSEEHL